MEDIWEIPGCMHQQHVHGRTHAHPIFVLLCRFSKSIIILCTHVKVVNAFVLINVLAVKYMAVYVETYWINKMYSTAENYIISLSMEMEMGTRQTTLVKLPFWFSFVINNRFIWEEQKSVSEFFPSMNFNKLNVFPAIKQTNQAFHLVAVIFSMLPRCCIQVIWQCLSLYVYDPF